MALTRPRALQIFDLDYKQAVRAITVSNVTLSGGAPATVDGVALAAKDRVLVNGQGTASQNGIYEVETLGTGTNGTWVRTVDATTNGTLLAGAIVMVTEGAVFADTQWKLVTDNPIEIGTTALTWEQNSAFAFGNIFANGTPVLANTVGDTLTLSNGNNIVITGNASAKSVTIAVSDDPNFSGNLSVTGNISGGNISTAGQVVATGNVSGGNLEAVGAIAAGTTINATGNITGGNLVTAGVTSTNTLTANGNANVGNLSTAGQVTATGNVSGGNINTTGQVTATGNVSGGNVTTAGAVDAGSITSTTTISATGNVSGGNLTTTGAVDAGSITSTTTITATGNVSGGNVVTAGTVDSAILAVSGNANVGNLSTAGTITATGNITGGNLITVGEAFSGTLRTTGDALINGNLTVQGNLSYINVEDLRVQDPVIIMGTGPNGAPLTQNDGLDRGIYMEYYTTDSGNAFVGWQNSTGNLILATDVEFLSNDVVQVNSYGTLQAGNAYLESAEVVGNITAGNISTSGTLETSGNLSANNLSATNSITAGTTITATGNVSGGNITTAGNVSGGNLVTAGAVDSATLAVSGNANVGNLSTAGQVTATGNVSGGNLVTAGAVDAGSITSTTTITATGNVSGGNVTTAGAVDAGSITSTTTITATGNVSGGNLVTAGDTSTNTLTATGNVSGGNITTAGQVTATGNVSGGNVVTAGTVDAGAVTATTTITATGNVSGGNVTTAGVVDAGSITSTTTISATGNVSGGNVTTAGIVDAGSITSTTTISATGNVSGGNLTTTGSVSATGNVSGGNLITIGNITATGNVAGDFFIGNGRFLTGIDTTLISNGNSEVRVYENGNVAVTIAGTSNVAVVSTDGLSISGNISATDDITANGNITGGNLITTGAVESASLSVTGNVDAGNLNTIGQVTATGNITGGNLSGTNITGTLLTADQPNITDVGTLNNLTVAGNTVSNTGTFGNITISGSNVNSDAGAITINSDGSDVDFAIDGDTTANVFYVDAGTETVSIGNSTQTPGATLAINSTDSILMPRGDTAERPDPGAIGMTRYNTEDDGLEVFTLTGGWKAVGVEFTVIASETFSGDDSTVAFTLATDQTTDSCIVSINGVVQQPITSYSVSGTTLTFTEAPLVGDTIEVRTLTTTTTVTGISNSSGNARLQVDDTSSDVTITGDLIPNANVTFDLGSTTARWNELYLAGNSIILGDLIIKNTGGNTVGFFGPDGTTPGTIDSTNIDSASISNGTTSLAVVSSDGNIQANVAGNAVGVFTGNGLVITGSIEATNGFIGLDATAIANGTANVRTFENANVTVSAGGSTDVLVVSGTGVGVTGTITATGNITGGNVSGTNLTGTLSTAAQTNITSVGTLSSLSVTGNITGGNLVTTGNIEAGNLKVTGIEAVTTLTVSGDTLISGNLTVSGTTLTANVQSLVVSDPVLGLGSGANGAPLVSNDGLDRGIKMFYFTTAEQIAFMGYDNSEGKMLSAANVSIANNVVTVNSLGTTVVGSLETSEIIKTGANGVGNIGSATNTFNAVFARATSALYADLAEKYLADKTYAAGTVLVFGGSAEVTKSTTDADHRVAGVVSTNPGFIMNAGLDGKHAVAVALTGRVPCRVCGPVAKGDLMVSSGNGYARSDNSARAGTIIGKALEDFTGKTGVIEVVVGRY